jgi:hypothetical protein
MPRLIGVRRKACTIGILATLLAAGATGYAPAYGRVVGSVKAFQRNFGDLKKADTLNAVERFVFSLVLSKAKAPAADCHGRT